jgi:formate dehydrogenase iron-sulfur subunit
MIRVFVPRDSAARSVGADDVARAIAQTAVERGVPVQIVRNGSRGALWLEPLVEVESADGRVAYGPVAPADIAGMFDAGFLEGGAHPLGQGDAARIDYLARQQRVTFHRCGVIDPVSVEDYRAHGGFDGLLHALAQPGAATIEAVTQSGLRGRGGAGFPAGIKWKTVGDLDAPQKYVCCNADEGDSGTFADRMLMEGDPLTLIEGMTIAGVATGATRGFIYLRSEYPDAAVALREAMANARAANWLGRNIQQSGFDFDIELRMGAGAYICGEETAMLESLEGRRGMVRAKPPIPAIQGLFGAPTVINNVLTLAAVPEILAKGPAAYQVYGVGRSRGTQPFQLSGNILRGGLVEVPFGMTLRTLIEDFGGGTASGRPVRAVQVGGPLGAYLTPEQFDLPLDYEVFAANGAMLGHGGIVVFDDSVDLAEQARFAMEFCAVESCGKCTPCRIGSTRGVEILDRILLGNEPGDDLQLLEDLCQTMTDGSLCAMGGLTPMPVLSALRNFPEDFDRSARVAAQ